MSGLELTRLLADTQRVAGIGIWETNLATLAVHWSDETHRIFGLGPGEFKATHSAFLEFVHPDDRARVDAAFRESATRTTPSSIEHRILTRDGRVRHIEERWQVFPGVRGESERAVGTCRDVTERIVEEETRRFNEAMLRIAGRASRVGGWVVNLSDGVVVWSEVTSEIHELPPGASMPVSEAIGFYAPEWREKITELFGACARDGVSFDAELQILTAKGRRVWVRAIGEAVRDAGGAITRVQGAFQDISERKALEAQLLRTQRMESIGTLAGGIAHDLNNALSPIIMSLELLKARIPDDDGRQMLATLETSAIHAAGLVKQVLTFARGVKGEAVPLDPARIAADAHRLIADTFPKNISFQFQPSAGLWTVIGDATQINQVLLNLAVNARDAMPRGGTLGLSMENVVIDAAFVKAHPEGNPGKHLRIRVSDTGVGMAPEVRERAFDPFFTTKEVGKGTGLGLSTALSIVRGHRGFITLSGEAGKGTTFDVYLPAEDAAPEAAKPVVAAAPVSRGRGALVLIVDDEASVRSIARRIMEAAGYRVLVAADGTEALALYAQHRKDVALVFTDMAMPRMDGPATIAALLALDPALKIIGSSGNTSDADVAKALASGLRDYIAKPYTAGTLLQALEKTLSGEPRP